jgi:hypothetical protein
MVSFLALHDEMGSMAHERATQSLRTYVGSYHNLSPDLDNDDRITLGKVIHCLGR